MTGWAACKRRAARSLARTALLTKCMAQRRVAIDVTVGATGRHAGSRSAHLWCRRECASTHARSLRNRAGWRDCGSATIRCDSADTRR